jgi:hypothetical protein
MNSLAFILVLISTLSVLAKGDSISCDMITDETVCLYGGDKIVTMDAGQSDLVLRLTFDTETLYDSSGQMNHPVSQVTSFGSGVLGAGYSGKISEDEYIEIENSDDFNGDEYSISFWMYIEESEVSPLRIG